MLELFLQLYLTSREKKAFQESAFIALFHHFLPFPDAVSVAVQPAGEAATAEMVHTDKWAGEEEGDTGHDSVSASPSTTFLQLPPVERPEDCLQEVVTKDTLYKTFRLWFVPFLTGIELFAQLLLMINS